MSNDTRSRSHNMTLPITFDAERHAHTMLSALIDLPAGPSLVKMTASESAAVTQRIPVI